MLYEFKSRAAGTVVMTAAVAEQLLAIVGKAPGPRGIFTVEQMAPALAALQAAVDQEAMAVAAEQETEPEDPRQPPPIRLRQRAWPLMDLLRTAQAKGKDVTWGV
jgi:hypothetical protein